MLGVTASWQVVLASWALTYLLHSTVFLGLAWVITRLDWFRGPRTREVIWTVALVGGIATSLGATLNRTPVSHREIDVEVRRMVGGPAPGTEPADPPLGRLERLEWHADADGPMTLAAAPGEACRAALRGPGPRGEAWLASVRTACFPAAGARWLPALLVLWLLGAWGLGWRELARYGAMRRVRQGLTPASPRAIYTLARVVDGLELGPVRAAVSTEVDGPCVVDSRTVVLPPRCLEELDDPELLAVLAHEVAHIKRHEIRRQSLFRLLAVAFWFQPLNRVALRSLHDVAELICDDWAVGRIPRPLDLARSISRVAEWSVPGSRRQPVLAGSQGGRLSERVRRILGSSGDGRSEGRLRGALVAVALVVTLAQLPSVPAPGAAAGIFVMRENAGVEGAPGFLPGPSLEPDSTAEVHLVRVRVREIES